MPDSKNHNEDPIEHLFRKKAEEYDISYREEDWLNLEKQLDRRDRQRAARKKRWIIAAVVLFLFSLLGYAVYQNYQDINRINEQLSDQQAVETEQQERGEELPDEQPDAGEKQEIDEREDAGERSEPPSGSPENETATPDDPRPSFAGQEDTGAADDGERYESSQTPGPGVSDEAIPRVSAGELSCAVCRLSDFGSGKKEQAHVQLSRATSALPGAMAARETSATADFFGGQDRRQPSPAASRAFIGLAAGPDLSTVGALSDFDQPGYNLGLLFEYRLRSNFSIRGGLMRASVNYVADGSEYHPPGGFWSYDTVPDQTSARCIILDIPVSLKYEFWQLQRSGFYATAGFNSYIMLNEDYRFDYGYEHSDSDPVQQWSDKTRTRHWMSNATISVGYAINLNPRLSLQVEPFLKLPMREVGWGNVKLYSMGSFISLNYTLY
ncbi:outer membrane beta-barrel protein [Fodinibius sp.]|uniref:outer membrane beta-barrel protein n=1 Tax=Fodinibius sp. TaxID=1872440 RepID=UPI00356A993E